MGSLARHRGLAHTARAVVDRRLLSVRFGKSHESPMNGRRSRHVMAAVSSETPIQLGHSANAKPKPLGAPSRSIHMPAQEICGRFQAMHLATWAP